MEITLKEIKNLRIAHTEHMKSNINSIDYQNNGERLCFTTSEFIFLVKIGERVSTSSFNPKGRCGIAKFMTGGNGIVHSMDENFDVRLLDITKNHYVHYFPGHSMKVINLEIPSTERNFFVSSSNDTSVRCWDPRQRQHTQMRPFPSPPLIALHPEGTLLFVAYNSDTIEIFEIRNLKEGIGKFKSEKEDDVDWVSLKFSPNGKMLLVTTNSSYILIFNTITRCEMFKLTGFTNRKNETFEANFSPDENFVMGGSKEGTIHVWGLRNHGFKEYCLKNPRYPGPCYNVAINPALINIASTSDSKKLHLWIEKTS